MQERALQDQDGAVISQTPDFLHQPMKRGRMRILLVVRQIACDDRDVNTFVDRGAHGITKTTFGLEQIPY
ncbi:hypothetical protein A8H39_00480 [Paraburkholderia fungorum]|nr:hypothetical protein A8H39_00480 [Paraburkholderia fungorum]